MLRLFAALLMVCSAAPAFARYPMGKVHMTCAQARNMANRTGYVTMENANGVVDIGLIGLEGVTVPFGYGVVVVAVDNPNCLVGYIPNDNDHGR